MQTWPEQELLIVAVNAETGERRAFDRNSGIDLVDAEIASSAFFGSPPTLIQGPHYIDGGCYSTENADLAIGFDQVLIFALSATDLSLRVVSLAVAVETLRDSHARVDIVHPDENTLAAFASAGNMMSPAVCEPAARAGRLQGRRVINERVCSVW